MLAAAGVKNPSLCRSRSWHTHLVLYSIALQLFFAGIFILLRNAYKMPAGIDETMSTCQERAIRNRSFHLHW